MSRSSRRSGGERGDGARDRAQTEPIAALVAVLAIAIGLALYAGVAADQSPSREEPDAEATMQHVAAEILEDGVFGGSDDVDPEQFERPGESVRFELVRRNGRVRTMGPRPPDDADSATRPVTVEDGVGRYPTRLTVYVWES